MTMTTKVSPSHRPSGLSSIIVLWEKTRPMRNKLLASFLLLLGCVKPEQGPPPAAPGDAALMKKIADNGGADWIGDWTPHVGNWVSKRVTIIQKTGALPLFIAYNLPKRDCGQHSSGGTKTADQY